MISPLLPIILIKCFFSDINLKKELKMEEKKKIQKKIKRK